MVILSSIKCFSFPQSVFNNKQTPCNTQCDMCSSVVRSASNTRPTPIALRRVDVVYTGVQYVFYINI